MEKELKIWAEMWLVPALLALFVIFQSRDAWATPAAGLKYESLFQKYERLYDLPSGLLSRMAYQESRYDPQAVSPAGAQGLMQFMPATAAEFGIDPFDPEQAINGAGQYLRWLYDRLKDWKKVLAAYNFGIGNVQRGEKWPSETVAYVRNISKDVRLS